ncbi:translocase [Lacimonas salitolerans]|uniref:Translocase n=1 Tax=Lacimonas salitolerans TaxID=1323750 RepID=A0ABW4EIS7_9RHOB
MKTVAHPRPSLLTQLITGAPETGAPSLWHQTELVDQFPSDRLRALEAHRREVTPTWLDRIGMGFSAHVAGLRPQLPRLRRLATRVLKRRLDFSAMPEDMFAGTLRDVADQCRISHRAAARDVGMGDLVALAAVSEAVFRVNGFVPHREQLMAAIALLEGRMAEMATGEGKTITAAIAATVAAWRGLPCHVVTANDYLAARDAELGQPLFALCQVSAASVTGDTPPEARAVGYRHDIVYTTAKDLLADHLRDQLALGQRGFRVRFALAAARNGAQADVPDVTTRGLFQVIVDEADSVLIDEALTPLIISAQRPDDLLVDAAQEAVRLARALTPEADYRIRPMLRDVQLTSSGKEMLHRLTRQLDPFWRRRDRAEELVQMALYADHMMERDRHFVVEDGKVVLIDELTGRLARQRTLSLGMQQVLEAAEGLEISPLSEVRARQSFQRFFRLFRRLGGMTGTASEARSEFARAYGLTTLKIPTHRKVRRRRWATRVFANEQVKFAAIATEAAQLSRAGRAVLIGVRSLRVSEALHAYLMQAHPDVPIKMLNAVNNEHESTVVAAAGQRGALTIATNLAGRGTDIKLDPSVREKGGLHVIVAESNDFLRIDRQLIGRCARQGDPGSYRRFISLDEELIHRFLPHPLLALWQLQRSAIPPLNGAMAIAMIRQVRARAARLAVRQRLQMLKADIESDKAGI